MSMKTDHNPERKNVVCVPDYEDISNTIEHHIIPDAVAYCTPEEQARLVVELHAAAYRIENSLRTEAKIEAHTEAFA
jgi:hypothetical protein